MKEPGKRSEGNSASNEQILRRAWVERDAEDNEAKSLLSQLESSLKERSAELKRAVIRCSAFHEDVQRIVAHESILCVKDDVTALALRLIAAKHLDPAQQITPLLIQIIQGQQTLLDPLYRKIDFGIGCSDHLAIFKQWTVERAAIEILQRAIKLHKASMVVKGPIAMEKFSRAVAGIRSEVARDLVAKLAELNSIADRDRHLGDGLDASDIQVLRPKPFPLRFLSSEAIAWLMDAISQQLLAPTALRDLLEPVSTDKAEPAA
jgi:hypothetical protein